MAFSTSKVYRCTSCGYRGSDWVGKGIWDMSEVDMPTYYLANCPECGTSKCVERVEE